MEVKRQHLQILRNDAVNSGDEIQLRDAISDARKARKMR